MITVKIFGIEKTLANLGESSKRVRVAAAAALNDAAYQGKRATEAEIKRVFDRPTPWIQRSVRYVKANKTNLTAKIDFDAWGNKTSVTAAMTLAAQIYGGTRKNKRHEVALQKAGILRPGHAIVPGPAAKFDQYGGMAASQIVQIVSWFKAFGEQGYRANMRDGGKRLAKDNKKTGAKGFSYFALQKSHGKLIPGIYQRITFGVGSAVRPVMYFVNLPKYRRRLDFYGIAERAAVAEFNKQFQLYLDQP